MREKRLRKGLRWNLSIHLCLFDSPRHSKGGGAALHLVKQNAGHMDFRRCTATLGGDTGQKLGKLGRKRSCDLLGLWSDLMLVVIGSQILGLLVLSLL